MRKTLLLAFFVWVIVCSCNDKVESVVSPNVLSAYPNPSINNFSVIVYNATGVSAHLVVFDPKGEIVLDQKLGTGTNQIQVQVADRPTGRFHVICEIGSTIYTTDVLKI